jgi:arylsulfatase A-like enzyme
MNIQRMLKKAFGRTGMLKAAFLFGATACANALCAPSRTSTLTGRLEAGTVKDDLCLNIDFAPTFLDFAAADIPLL